MKIPIQLFILLPFLAESYRYAPLKLQRKVESYRHSATLFDWVDKIRYNKVSVALLISLSTTFFFQPHSLLAETNGKASVSALIESIDWKNDIHDFQEEDFRRLDESNDDIFYSYPRFVEHIDMSAVKALTSYQTKLINSYATKSNKISVLDLCSSWVSHIDQSRFTNGQQFKMTGLGMNNEELARNGQLSDYIVQDLNKNVHLPFEDKSFDVVLIQLSIDYLTKPVEVLKEVKRVLKPEGTISVSFSNRMFYDKAVAIWTGKSDEDHIETVAQYLYLAGFPEDRIQAKDLKVEEGVSIKGDPIYAVIGVNST